MTIRQCILFSASIVLVSGCKPAPGINPPAPGEVVIASPAPDEVLEETIQPTKIPVTPLPSTPKLATSTPSATQKPVTSKIAIQSLPSEYFSDDTRDINAVDTIVVHSLYNPESSTPFSIQSGKAILDKYQVSTHYIVDREGGVWRLVPEDRQAWHAGESTMPAPDNRTKVNLFSVGIELIGSETSGFTDAQYSSIVSLTSDVMNRLPIKVIVGHDDIAPGRKTDPWGFDWNRYQNSLKSANSKTVQFLN